jgi:putative ABC transport system permease protein
MRSRLYDHAGVTAVTIRDEQRADLRSLLAVFDALLTVMLVFSAAMAFAVLVNAMTINVLEREREYATMRALGARPRVIARLLGVEAALLWAVALVPGLVAGAWIATLLADAIAADLFVLEVRATPGTYLVAGGGVLAISLLSLLLPMRRIRRTDLAVATKTLG